MTALCVFRLDDQLLAVEASAVREVVRAAAVTPVPGMPTGVAGVVNLRGDILTALDLRACLGLPPGPGTTAGVVVAGDLECVSLQVDDVHDVVDLGSTRREPVSTTVSSSAPTLVLGAYRFGDGVVLELDPHALIGLATGEQRTEQE